MTYDSQGGPAQRRRNGCAIQLALILLALVLYVAIGVLLV
jgi:hypothetical protein